MIILNTIHCSVLAHLISRQPLTTSIDKESILAKKRQQNAEPPQPPPIERKLKLYLTQIIGIPLLILVPVLALLGMFGETEDKVTTSNPQLEMQVDYPTRFRYKMLDSVIVSLSNTSAQPISAVEVGFERSYVEGFSTVTFTPAAHEITDSAYFVEVADLQPGETRIISVDIQAEKYGRHQGAITATAENAEALRVLIETFTFP